MGAVGSPRGEDRGPGNVWEPPAKGGGPRARRRGRATGASAAAPLAAGQRARQHVAASPPAAANPHRRAESPAHTSQRPPHPRPAPCGGRGGGLRRRPLVNDCFKKLSRSRSQDPQKWRSNQGHTLQTPDAWMRTHLPWIWGWQCSYAVVCVGGGGHSRRGRRPDRQHGWGQQQQQHRRHGCDNLCAGQLRRAQNESRRQETERRILRGLL